MTRIGTRIRPGDCRRRRKAPAAVVIVLVLDPDLGSDPLHPRPCPRHPRAIAGSVRIPDGRAGLKFGRAMASARSGVYTRRKLAPRPEGGGATRAVPMPRPPRNRTPG